MVSNGGNDRGGRDSVESSKDVKMGSCLRLLEGSPRSDDKFE